MRLPDLVRKFSPNLRPTTEKELLKIYRKYKDYTMVNVDHYLDNLRLAAKCSALPGDVVECGVWKGGMIGGIAEVLGTGPKYYLFDSFEGLPLVRDIDGEAAKAWQADAGSPGYFDNCRADEAFAVEAMSLANV